MEPGKIIVPLKEIKKILPHRGDKLLLDAVAIEDDMLIGHLIVRKETCKNHKIRGQLVMRGVDFGDMAFQLLAVGVSNLPQYSYLKGRDGMGRSFGKIVFKNPAYPVSRVRMEIKRSEITVIPGSPDKENMIVGKQAVVIGSDEKKIGIFNDIRLAVLKNELQEEKLIFKILLKLEKFFKFI